MLKVEYVYNIIVDNVLLFNELGIIDFWMVFVYMLFNRSWYNEGYLMIDCYNLGIEVNLIKYGSGEEFLNVIVVLYDVGLKV